MVKGNNFRPDQQAVATDKGRREEGMVPPPPFAEDVRLMSMVAAADPVAQRTLVERLMGRVRRVSGSILRDGADAEDATQVCLVEILRSAGTYKGDAPVERWADRIVVRHTSRMLREKRASVSMRVDNADFEAVAAAAPDESATDDAPRQIDAYLSRLPPELRTVLVLRHGLDYSIDEISRLTSASPNTVKDRLLRGREYVRKMIRRDQAIGVRVPVGAC
ncbi:MAG: sigma-70 family RNA polymerase sigma factor [Deltaproteobacteria bacterium]|nr:sigma-70 family RNA polymerase sigma factor [Deltaproteobacteria bacterium]